MKKKATFLVGSLCEKEEEEKGVGEIASTFSQWLPLSLLLRKKAKNVHVLAFLAWLGLCRYR